jgi:hypothetical protein
VEVNIYKNLSKQHSPRFGEIAVDMGFVTEEQLKEALVEQVEDNLSNHPHRFIGYILFENGWITNEQFDSALNILFNASA